MRWSHENGPPDKIFCRSKFRSNVQSSSQTSKDLCFLFERFDLHLENPGRPNCRTKSIFDCYQSLDRVEFKVHSGQALVLALVAATLLVGVLMDYRLTDLYERRLRPLYDALDSGNWKVRLIYTKPCIVLLARLITSAV